MARSASPLNLDYCTLHDFPWVSNFVVVMHIIEVRVLRGIVGGLEGPVGQPSVKMSFMRVWRRVLRRSESRQAKL